jgi:energy-coupling factor transport system substrate-specific component
MIVIKNAFLRSFLSKILPFLVIPAVVISGSFVFRDKSYSYVIMAVVVLTIVLFVSGFEKRKIGTRRLVLTAAFVALASIGRVICSPLPGVNPVTAITIFAAIYMGSETGFMVGAFSALISNMFAGMGVWTPFQMFAWGLIGTFAGLFSKQLINNKIKLCVYALFAGIFYSLIMDIWTVIWAYNSFNLSAYLAAVTTAVPYTAVYAISNCVFVYLLAKPFSEKLGRIKIKYGI